MIKKKALAITGVIGAAFAAVGYFFWRRKRDG